MRWTPLTVGGCCCYWLDCSRLYGGSENLRPHCRLKARNVGPKAQRAQFRARVLPAISQASWGLGKRRRFSNETSANLRRQDPKRAALRLHSPISKRSLPLPWRAEHRGRRRRRASGGPWKRCERVTGPGERAPETPARLAACVQED